MSEKVTKTDVFGDSSPWAKIALQFGYIWKADSSRKTQVIVYETIFLKGLILVLY